MRSLPAAGIPSGAIVRVALGTADLRVLRVLNSTPRPGLITWHTPEGDVQIGAAVNVTIVSLP